MIWKKNQTVKYYVVFSFAFLNLELRYAIACNNIEFRKGGANDFYKRLL